MIKRIILLFLAFTLSGQTPKEEKYFKAFTMSGGTFDTNVGVIITNDTLKALEVISYLHQSLDVTMEDFEVRGICFSSDAFPTIMWLSKPPETIEEISIANHELFHLTSDILRWANVPLDESSEEVYAYMLGYLTKQFYTNINN